MPSARITFRLTAALEPLVAERVRQGTPVSDIMRAALEQYFGVTPPPAAVSDTTAQVSDIRAAVSDIQTRLAHLEARLVAPVLAEAHRQTLSDNLSDTPATAERPADLPAYLLPIAEVAAAYNKLTLVELAQLLYDRHIYRSTDRTTGAAKPVNKGTLQRWLAMARAAGLL
jgi:hypothetical protein